jgi:hypothetical protein
VTAPASRADQIPEPTVTTAERTLEWAASIAADPLHPQTSEAWRWSCDQYRFLILRSVNSVVKRTGRTELVDDVEQEARILFWKMLSKYDPAANCSAKTYIYNYLTLQLMKIVLTWLPPVHVSQSQMESGVRANAVPIDAPINGSDDSEGATLLVDTLIAPGPGPEELAMHSERVNHFAAMGNQAGAAMLHLMAGYTQRDTARQLGVTQQAVSLYVKSFTK